MEEERTQKNIIRAIITLTEQLNVDVIAEGIETQPQLEELVGLGCNLGQGYLISQPLDTIGVESALAIMPKDEIGNLLWKQD
jgi:EAL domain-containing protein (putative c-di-GMP-specific phosphodiesterase class I)